MFRLIVRRKYRKDCDPYSHSSDSKSKSKSKNSSLPSKKSISKMLPWLLSKAKSHNHKRASRPFSSPSTNGPGLFDIPLELRQIIYAYVFQNNGISDLRQHLVHGRFCLSKRNYSVYHGLEMLLVSKQFYADALPIAYQMSCFYVSERKVVDGGTALFPGWKPEMRGHVKHLAIWADPFAWPGTRAAILEAGMKLRVLTLCDSSLYKHVWDHVVSFAGWLVDVSVEVEGLRELRFFVGRVNMMWEHCQQLRQAIEKVVEDKIEGNLGEGGEGSERDETEVDFEMSPFDEENHSAVLSIGGKGRRVRSVLLTVATTAEAGKASLLSAKGIGDECWPKGFRFKDLREGETND